MRRLLTIISLLTITLSLFAQQRSAKRGMGWDEATQQLTDAPISKMAPGVSWIYNWGPSVVGSATNIGAGEGKMAFAPMCWNAAYDNARIRNYISSHEGEVKYLLGFNEPNLAWNVGGAQMTPQEAVDAWPGVKAIAADYGLELVAPALNFSGDQVGGRVWSPFEWYDEFFRLCSEANLDPAIDYLAFHSYMNWYSAVNWVASEYFYTDKETGNLMSTNNRALYPNLVKYMEDYKTAKGHYPKMFLTEFCAWEGDKDGYTSSVDSQIDQMTQKVQKLEQSDLVAGYAWFMGNTSQAPSSYPYNSVFMSNTSSSELSTLGKVYVHMSSFDTEKYYAPGEQILAKDYINASMDGQQAKVRPNTESGSDIPLQVEWQVSAWTSYQVDIPTAGQYSLTLHMKSTTANDFRGYRNATGGSNKLFDTSLPSTNGDWEDVTITVNLRAGKYALLLYNFGTSSILVNSIRIESTTGIRSATLSDKGQMINDDAVYDLSGRKVADNYALRITHYALPKGIYIYKGKKFVVK